jgi:hypothetical protein
MISSAIGWLFLNWLIVVSIIGAMLSLIGLIAEKRSQSKGRKTFPYVLIFIGGILTILVATVTTLRQSAQQAETERKNSKILSLTQQLLTKSDEIAGLNRKIAEKSDEITKLNRELMSSVIGGKSFCYLFPMLKQGIPRFTLIHQGKYPLYDLTIRIVDLDKFDELKEKAFSFESLFEDEITVNVGNFAPNSAQILSQVQIRPKETLRYNVFFSARNGFFTQILRIKKLGTEWKTAFKVTVVRPQENKERIIFEKIDEGYPRNEKGLVQW